MEETERGEEVEASGGALGGLIDMGCCLKCEGHPGEQEVTERNCEAGLVALQRGDCRGQEWRPGGQQEAWARELRNL